MLEIILIIITITIPISFNKSTIQSAKRFQILCSTPSENNQTVISVGNCEGKLYYVTAGIGSPPQYFNLQIDTGSDILWLPTIDVQAKGFNSTLSSTYYNKSQQYEISYINGEQVTGFLGTDFVTFQDTNINASLLMLFAYSQNITLPEQIDGVIGLGFTSFHFLRNSFSHSQIQTSAFTLQLKENTEQSRLYYNQIPQHIQKQSIFTSVDWDAFWSAQIVSVLVDDIDLSKYAADVALIDSGTTLFYLNPQLKQAFVNEFLVGKNCNFTNSNNIICDCQTALKLPTFTFMFTDLEVYLTPYDYVELLGPICLVQIHEVSTNPPQILLGDLLFHQYQITFDQKNSSLGFYGNTTAIYSFGSRSFSILQYIMVTFLVLLLFLFFTTLFQVKTSIVKLNENLNESRRGQTQEEIQRQQLN